MTLETLLDKYYMYRKLSSSNNPFIFKQSDYDKYLYYKQKLKEYAQKEGYKAGGTLNPTKFIPMSDFTEQFENYQF